MVGVKINLKWKIQEISVDYTTSKFGSQTPRDYKDKTLSRGDSPLEREKCLKFSNILVQDFWQWGNQLKRHFSGKIILKKNK